MKPIICFYCDGSEAKLAVITKEKEEISVIKTASITTTSTVESEPQMQQPTDLDFDSSSDSISFDSLDEPSVSGGAEVDHSEVSMLASFLADVKLSNATFIPVVTEPVVNFHVYDGGTETDKNKILDAIIEDIERAKGIMVSREMVDCVELESNSYLGAFFDAHIPCVNFIDSLASYHNKRYFKIGSIKNAEIALANYVARSTKFFPEDYSLVIHIGQDTSKLIFLEGQNLKHIGSTLDIGTRNLHTYDVYFSKILLEMENGGIPRLDNVVLCGDDRSENLVLSFYGTFPEANVIELNFDVFDFSYLDEESKKDISSFSIPLATAFEYYGELNKEFSGINIMPKYISDNQKALQFAWHSYFVLACIFGITFVMMLWYLSLNSEMEKLDKEIVRLTELQRRNEEIISKINPLKDKIGSFDATQSILDSATVGTEIWGRTLDSYSDFIERRRNFWITHIESTNEKELELRGYSLSRASLTEFARDNDASILKNVLYEPLREKNAFSYQISLQLKEK
jgi:hypothetical protein